MTIGLPTRVPAPTTPPAPGGKPGISGWAKKNPTLALGGAGITVVVLVALISKKSAAAGSGTVDPITGQPVAAGQITPNQGGYYDSTANDVYQSIMGQIQTLQAQVTGLTPGASDPTPKPTGAASTPTPVAVETAAAAFARRHVAYLATPAGAAATARVDARTAAAAAADAAAASYTRRHAAYLLTPAGIAATARNKK